MALDDNITPSLGTAVSTASAVVDAASAAIARDEDQRKETQRLYNSIVSVINSADLLPSQVSELLATLSSDLTAGGNGRVNISAALAGIWAKIQEEIQEKDAEVKKAVAYQIEAAQEAKRDAGIVTRTVRAILPKALMPAESHNIDISHQKVDLRDNNEEYSFASMVKGSAVVATAYVQKKFDSLKKAAEETVAYAGSRAVDAAGNAADKAHAAAVAGGATKDYLVGLVTGDSAQQHRGEVVFKAGIERNLDSIDHKLETVGKLVDKALDGNVGEAVSGFVTGLGRNIIGDHTKLELDELLPELERKGWGNVSGYDGKPMFGIGNGKLTAESVRAGLEKYNIRLVVDEGDISGKQVTDLMMKAVESDKRIAMQAKAATLTPMEKAIQQARKLVDRDGDKQLSKEEIDAALAKVGKTFKSVAGKDDKVSNAELVAALGTMTPVHANGTNPAHSSKTRPTH